MMLVTMQVTVLVESVDEALKAKESMEKTLESEVASAIVEITDEIEV